jgi:hypothetical protein
MITLFHKIALAFSAWLVLLPCGGPGPAQGNTGLEEYKLVRQWEVPIGTSTELALCPDGSIFLLNERGAIRTIKADGTEPHSAVTDPSIKHALHIACDRQGRLYVLDKQLRVFGSDAGATLSLITSIQPKVHLVGPFLVAPNGSIYGFTADRMVVAIDQHGAVETFSSTYQPPPIVTSAPDPIPAPDMSAPHGDPVPVPGMLSWDETRNRLIYSLFGDNGVHFLNPSNPSDSLKISRRSPISSLRRQGKVVNLADGNFAALLLEKSEIADASNRYYLYILDGSLEPAAKPVPAEGVTALIGSSDDGSLCFLQAQRQGFKLIKERLVSISTPAS